MTEINDEPGQDAPAGPSEKRYKIYKFELIRAQQAIRDDLEFLRISEPGYIVGILPMGEKDMRTVMRFMIKDKCFFEIKAGDELIAPGHRTIQGLMDYMTGFPKPADGAVKTAPVLNDSPGALLNTLALKNKSANATEYRLMPAAKKLASGPALPSKQDEKPKTAAFAIPDKYKIKRSDKTDET